MKTYVGIDNGVTGTIGILTPEGTCELLPTPTKSVQSYTKTKQNITRLDWLAFGKILENLSNCVTILMERPLVNPGMFKATASALRCHEAQLVILEECELPYMFIDSKEWQKDLLPSGCKGRDELKKASMDIGIRLFPELSAAITKQKDADGVLIAEWARRKGL